VLLSIIIVPLYSKLGKADAMTQYYFSIPDVIQDLRGVSLSAEIQDEHNFRVFSSNIMENHSYLIIEPPWNG
jgi:REP element-mobilizing transposase RayT